jgi:hypothetical protein
MDPGCGRNKKAASKNDAKQMLTLILKFFQVTLWDGSRVEGAAGNKKAAKQNAAKLMLDVLEGRAKVRVHKIWRKEG